MKKQNPFLNISNTQWWGWFAALVPLAAFNLIVFGSALPYVLRCVLEIVAAIAAGVIIYCRLWPPAPPITKLTVTDWGVKLKNGIAPFSELTWDQIEEIGLIHMRTFTIYDGGPTWCEFLVYVSTRALSDVERVNCNWVRELGKDGSVILARMDYRVKTKVLKPDYQQLLERANLLAFVTDVKSLYSMWNHKYSAYNIRCVYAQMKDQLVWKVSQTTFDNLRCELSIGKMFLAGIVMGLIVMAAAFTVVFPLL